MCVLVKLLTQSTSGNILIEWTPEQNEYNVAILLLLIIDRKILFNAI